ncbi:MAG: CidA/LrgA family protein [Nitratireductor sp.]|nr:CidA/LrgA family protein [Nitratireductor sp.]
MLAWFTLILCCQLAGEVAAGLLALPVPGPVLGMVLLFLFMAMKREIPVGLAQTGDALLSNLSLLFVPAGVGIMAHAALLAQDWQALSVAVVVSTVLTIAVTALVMVWIKRLAAGGTKDA